MAGCAKKICIGSRLAKLGLWHPLRDHYNEAEIETHRNYQHNFFSFRNKMNRDLHMAHKTIYVMKYLMQNVSVCHWASFYLRSRDQKTKVVFTGIFLWLQLRQNSTIMTSFCGQQPNVQHGLLQGAFGREIAGEGRGGGGSGLI